MKKILSAAVALLCFFSVSVFSPSKSEAATAMTEASFQTSLEKFRNTVYGEGSTYKNNVKLYGGAQCFGYANQLAKYIYGSYPTGSMSGVGVSGGWQVSYGAEAVDALHVGDIVRFITGTFSSRTQTRTERTRLRGKAGWRFPILKSLSPKSLPPAFAPRTEYGTRAGSPITKTGKTCRNRP